MSRSYHRVYPAIWDEPWTDDVRYLALYLLTCRHRRTEGLFQLPVAYVPADLRWTEARVRKAWDALIKHGFIQYDEAVSLVWIVKAIERQPPDNPNQVKAVLSALSDLPASPLRNRFVESARTVSERFREAFDERFPGGYGDSPPPPPAPETALSASADVIEPTHIDEARARLKANADVQAVFDAWVEATGKDKARTKLDPKRRRRIVAALDGYPLDDVLAAVRGWKRSPYHRGENSTATIYNDLDLLLRDASKIEQFRDYERGSAGSSGQVEESPAARAARWQREHGGAQ